MLSITFDVIGETSHFPIVMNLDILSLRQKYMVLDHTVKPYLKCLVVQEKFGEIFLVTKNLSLNESL